MSRTIRLPKVPPRPWKQEGMEIISADGEPVGLACDRSHVMKFILDAVNAYPVEPPTEIIISDSPSSFKD